MPSDSIENYLKALWDLGRAGEQVTTSALARRLEISSASVTGMLRNLAARKPRWVIYEKSRGARLTEVGERQALKVIRHHRLIELFLYQTLGLAWDEVHQEAERLEHAFSPNLVDHLARFLNNPETDPHGHAIPRKDGTLPRAKAISLLDLPVGIAATVSQVSDEDSELLRYLARLGMRPGAQVVVEEKGPFEGPLMIRVSDSPKACAVSLRIARDVFVLTPKTRKRAQKK
ncbi:MAG: metal-dependent transcriptional regulator [bacterium]